MSIVFLLSHIPNPRMNKRIEVAKSLSKTALVCWDKQANHVWDLHHQDIENVVIRVAASGTEPLKRIFQTLIFGIKSIKQLQKLRPKCIYVGNMDMLIIAYLYFIGHKTNIIYEIADLNKLIDSEHKGIMKNMVRRVLVNIEKQLCRKIKALVLTSDKYYDQYYSRFIPKEKVMVIPNIPSLSVFESYKANCNDKFTIGFIGGIRYIQQIKMMVDAAEHCGFHVLIAGAGFSLDEETDIRNYCKDKDFVKFTGRYDYAKEVAFLYGKCNCIYSVYDADINNVKVALPNKLYESIYCELPILVSKGTYLAEIVQKMGVGIAVSHKNIAELEEILNRLYTDKDYYNSFVKACRGHKNEINIKVYNEKLAKRLKELV